MLRLRATALHNARAGIHNGMEKRYASHAIHITHAKHPKALPELKSLVFGHTFTGKN